MSHTSPMRARHMNKSDFSYVLVSNNSVDLVQFSCFWTLGVLEGKKLFDDAHC